MRYSICLINSNGYTIKKEFESVDKAKRFAKHYPLSVFFFESEAVKAQLAVTPVLLDLHPEI